LNNRKFPLKYFVCALDKINVGIPAERTERIISVTRTQGAVRETEDQQIFISLPVLFRQKNSGAEATPHGVVFKSNAGETSAVKTVLLAPRIDAEVEIPEEDVHSLPQAMTGAYRIFRGAYCTDANVTLILSPEKLMEAAL
jgi:hypothetical protein